jgi:N-acetylneuraminic acid mutarotase
MRHSLKVLSGLGGGVFALFACTDHTPTQPGDTGDRPGGSPEFAWASNSWQTRAPMPTERHKHAVGVVANSAGQQIVYVMGGGIDASDVTAIDAYNYETNTWTRKRAKFQVSYPNGIGVIGGKLYISGGILEIGESFNQVRPDLYVYDPVADVITRKANMPRSSAGGVTGVIGGKLYVLTPSCDECADKVSLRFIRYDPATNAWAFLTWAPRQHFQGAGGVINGKFYVTAGFDRGNNTTALDVYDPATNKWSTRAPMPRAIGEGAGTVLNNKLYIVGGGATGGLRDVFAYDPVSNTWSAKAALPTGRTRLAVATITAFGNSKILAMGGCGDTGCPTPENDAYKP